MENAMTRKRGEAVKPILLVVGFVLIMTSISGCASVARRADMICEGPLAAGPVTEVPTAVNPTPGMVGMIIKATIKTHPEDFYLLEPKGSLHGKSGLPFVVAIRPSSGWTTDNVRCFRFATRRANRFLAIPANRWLQ